MQPFGRLPPLITPQNTDRIRRMHEDPFGQTRAEIMQMVDLAVQHQRGDLLLQVWNQVFMTMSLDPRMKLDMVTSPATSPMVSEDHGQTPVSAFKKALEQIETKPTTITEGPILSSETSSPTPINSMLSTFSTVESKQQLSDRFKHAFSVQRPSHLSTEISSFHSANSEE